VFNKALLGISPFKDHKIDYGVPEMNEWMPVFQTLIERAPSWIVPVRTCELWARLYDPLRTQIAMVIGDQQSLDDALKNIRKEYETILEELGEKR
jgi:alpha-1,4-digalacturonate transport system substrate-binding protein